MHTYIGESGTLVELLGDLMCYSCFHLTQAAIAQQVTKINKEQRDEIVENK